MGFLPSKADANIRMKHCGTHCEYCCVYVDDVIFIERNPMSYLDDMDYEYNLKGIGQFEYYLGGDMEVGRNRKMAWSDKL